MTTEDKYSVPRTRPELEASDGVVRLADPTTGTRDVEPEAIKALFGGK